MYIFDNIYQYIIYLKYDRIAFILLHKNDEYVPIYVVSLVQKSFKKLKRKKRNFSLIFKKVVFLVCRYST